MLRTKAAALITILFTSVSFLYAIENPFPLPPSAISAGYSDGSFSSMLNPVFTDLDTTEDIAFRYLSYNGKSDGNFFSSVNLFGFDIIFSNYNTIPDISGNSIIDPGINVYSINRGFFFDNIFGFGAGYSFGSSSEYKFDNYSSWNAGLLFRPFPFISFGFVLKDLNGSIGGEKIDRKEIYSIAVRPWDEYLTLTADLVKKEHHGSELYYSGEVKGYKDISLIIKYGTDKSITAGLTLPLYIRSGRGTEITFDAYGSHKSETTDFKSAGIAFNFRRDKESAHIAASNNFINLKISGNYSAERDESGFFSKKESTFQDLVRGIERAGDDPSINGILIEIDNAGFGIAQVQEIRDLLNRARSKGKKVYAVLNYSGNKEYYLATASDKIFFTPNSTFKLTGLSARTYFFKGTLDKAGVKFESFSKGKYKSFSETFTRNEMSKDARENLTSIINDLNEQFISGITGERKLTRAAIEELFAKGFYTPAEAKEKGFIDEIMYSNEVTDFLKIKVKTISFAEYIHEKESVSIWGTIPAIAIINVTGSIVNGNGGMSGSTGDYDYQKSLDTAFGDPAVKAIVIRIDSGGGSAAASDFMWNALYSARKKNPKPVVFSFGNTAASGGYYIACTGDTIFAGRGTITGSIGVVAGKVSAEDLYSKLGISTETIKMSEFADIFSESRSLTQNEKNLFQNEINFIYDRFTGKVMEGRAISEKEIAEVAEGKIHTGDAAVRNKLINETGGIASAIEYAKIKGGVDSSYRIINLPENRSFLKGFFSDSETLSLIKHMQFIVRNIEKYRMFEEQTLYVQPYSIEIE